MYGLALPRRCYEIVFKNAEKKARDDGRKDGDGKVCGPLAAACNALEVHVLSPCFCRYRSISCFDHAALTYFDFYIFKTAILGARLSLPIQAVRLQSHMRDRPVYPRTRAPVLGGSKKRGSQSCPLKPLREPATEESKKCVKARIDAIFSMKTRGAPLLAFAAGRRLLNPPDV
jgi:hypothetical protein